MSKVGFWAFALERETKNRLIVWWVRIFFVLLRIDSARDCAHITNVNLNYN